MKKEELSQKEILTFLRKNKDLFKAKFYVDNIILFGSYARDEATPNSDIDILIESKKKSFRSYIGINKLLEEKFNKKVDVIYIDTVNPFIMEQIKEELVYA